MMPCCFQDLATCDPKGRDCIEKDLSKNFQCNTTCVGIFADVEWFKKVIEEEISEERSQETMKADLKGKIDDDLMKIYFLLKNEMKNDIGEVMRIATGQRGEELDKKKYNMLISEYKKFKAKNLRHFRFNSAANLGAFGKSNGFDGSDGFKNNL